MEDFLFTFPDYFCLFLSPQDMTGVLKVKDIETSNAFVLLDGDGDFNLMVGNMDVHQFISPSHVSDFKNDLL